MKENPNSYIIGPWFFLICTDEMREDILMVNPNRIEVEMLEQLLVEWLVGER